MTLTLKLTTCICLIIHVQLLGMWRWLRDEEKSRTGVLKMRGPQLHDDRQS